MNHVTPDLASAIITRQYDLSDGGHVDIFLWKPETKAEDYPTCMFLIRGIGQEKPRHGNGVDDVSAVISALQLIGLELYYSQEYKDGKLTWLGSRDLDLPQLPGQNAGQAEYEKAELLTLVSYFSVVLMPNNKFPYVAIPGERLNGLILQLKEIEQASLSDTNAKDRLGSLIEGLSVEQKYYEKVCLHAGLNPAYFVKASD